MERELPGFKYFHDPIATGDFAHNVKMICDCCGKETDVIYGSVENGQFYPGNFYPYKNDRSLCPWCIADGSAAEKFDGVFLDVDNCDPVDDPEKTDELIHRTPCYLSIQEPYWLAHCGDYCKFVGYVGWKEMIEMTPGEAPENVYRRDVSLFDIEELKECMMNGGGLQGYLFQCLHCGKHFLYADCD